MFPVTLETKSLKAAMEGAEGRERRARGRDRTRLNGDKKRA